MSLLFGLTACRVEEFAFTSKPTGEENSGAGVVVSIWLEMQIEWQ